MPISPTAMSLNATHPRNRHQLTFHGRQAHTLHNREAQRELPLDITSTSSQQKDSTLPRDPAATLTLANFRSEVTPALSTNASSLSTIQETTNANQPLEYLAIPNRTSTATESSDPPGLGEERRVLVNQGGPLESKCWRDRVDYGQLSGDEVHPPFHHLAADDDGREARKGDVDSTISRCRRCLAEYHAMAHWYCCVSENTVVGQGYSQALSVGFLSLSQ